MNMNYSVIDKTIEQDIYKVTYLNGNVIKFLSQKINNPSLLIHVYPTNHLAYYDPSDGTININIHFMSFIWMFCYVAFYSIENGNEKQMTPEQIESYGQMIDLNNQQIKDKKELLENEIKKVLNKSISVNNIDDSLVPDEINIQTKNNDYEVFISKVNGIYVRAISFILFHEYGHKNYKHIKTTVAQTLINEKQADEYAINCMLESEEEINDDILLNNGYGMLSGFLSLFFLSDYFGILFKNDHPSLIDRIKLVLEKITLISPTCKHLDYLKQYCCSVFVTALEAMNITIDNLDAGDNLEKYFEETYKEAYSYRNLFSLKLILQKSILFLVDDQTKTLLEIPLKINIYEKKIYFLLKSQLKSYNFTLYGRHENFDFILNCETIQDSRVELSEILFNEGSLSHSIENNNSCLIYLNNFIFKIVHIFKPINEL